MRTFFRAVTGSGLFIGVPLLLVSCDSRPSPRGPSVLLIVIDTLRADHLGAYGSQRVGISPALDRFSRDAIVYEQATSTAPFTMPSMAATLTGVYPDRAGVVNHSVQDSLRNFAGPTLAEVMSAAGYQTAAVVTNGWLKREGQGYDRGFDEYVIQPRQQVAAPGAREGTAVTDTVVQILERLGEQPFFIWAHYMEPHMPYQPPAADAVWAGAATGTSAVVRDFVHGDYDSKQQIYFHGDYPEAELAATRDLYAAEVRSVDREIGRLLAALGRMGGREQTIVIVMSDHGESLGEHGLFFAHDFTLYEELLQVPLIVRRPGVAGETVATPVSLVDIMPSLCGWLELDCPPSMDGIRLPDADNPVEENRNLFAASAPWRERYAGHPRQHVRGLEGRWRSIRRGHFKLIKIPHSDGPLWEFYDLAEDPAEATDLTETADQAIVDSMRNALAEWERLMDLARPGPDGVVQQLDARTLRELRALGYIR